MPVNAEHLERAKAINEIIAAQQRKLQAIKDEKIKKQKEALAKGEKQKKDAASKKGDRFKLEHTKEQQDRMIQINQQLMQEQAEKKQRKEDAKKKNKSADAAALEVPKTPTNRRHRPKASATSLKKTRNLAVDIDPQKLAMARGINMVYQDEQDAVQAVKDRKKEERRKKLAESVKTVEEKKRTILEFKGTSEQVERALRMNALFQETKLAKKKKGQVPPAAKQTEPIPVEEVSPLAHGPYTQYGQQIDDLRVQMDNEVLARRGLEMFGPLIEGQRPRRIEFEVETDDEAAAAAANEEGPRQPSPRPKTPEPIVERIDPQQRALELNKKFMEQDQLNKIKRKEMIEARLQKQRAQYTSLESSTVVVTAVASSSYTTSRAGGRSSIASSQRSTTTRRLPQQARSQHSGRQQQQNVGQQRQQQSVGQQRQPRSHSTNTRRR